MVSQRLQFVVEWRYWKARAGRIILNRKEVKTPIFMPVGTKATIKGIFLEMLRNPQYLWELEPVAMMLSNTFHLYLRPGVDIVQGAWGIHSFMNWPGLVLTDSGGFQVFSLWLSAQNKQLMTKKWPIVSVREEGIKFRSPLDWSRHVMSPEDCVDIQWQLWSDIMMMLDVCSPGWSDERIYKKQMDQTHRWATRQYNHYQHHQDTIPWVLFPIVQWWTNYNLRKESIDFLTPYATDGIAVGGVSVGESREQVKDIVNFCGEKLPEHLPRYLMGIWDVDTIRHAILSGFDMFDCVMPTRLGRHGVAYTHDGPIHMTNQRFRSDHSPLRSDASNGLSKMYTKAYIHHLLRENEVLWWLILSVHNIFYLHQLVTDMRSDILRG